MHKAFTLIELLVVVLIIGILSAIAVSQYQKAVLKSKFTTMLPLMRSIKEAQERYYMTNGKYTDSLSNLDIQIPRYCVNWLGYENMWYCNDWLLDSEKSSEQTGVLKAYFCPNTSEEERQENYLNCTSASPVVLRMYFDYYKDTSVAGKITCTPRDSLGVKLCKTFKGL